MQMRNLFGELTKQNPSFQQSMFVCSIPCLFGRFWLGIYSLIICYVSM
jgi:hypothetical protein